MNRGRFSKGPDDRRHLFTPEERSRGGRTRWRQIQAIWRAALNLARSGQQDRIAEDCKRRGIGA